MAALPPDAERCRKNVSDGGRSASFHRCGNRARPGSDFCGVHQKTKTTNAEPRDQAALPTVSRSARTTYRAELQWTPEAGPIIAPRYYAEGKLAVIVGAVGAIDDDQPIHRARVNLRGFILKKDGTPSQVHWDERYAAVDLLPEDARAILLEALEAQRRP